MTNINVRVSFCKAVLILSFCALAGFAHCLEAQALYTASKRVVFSVYAGASGVKPDYEADYNKNIFGYVMGAAATFRKKSLGISFEPRYGHISNRTITEDYLTVNLKTEVALGPGQRLHPYVMGGVGYGAIDTGFHDNSTVYALATGLDVDLIHNLAVKGDFQYQYWNLGSPHSSFNPNGYMGALIYRFHGVPYLRR